MTIDLSRIGNELALFADLGTDPPQVSADGDRLIVRMVREGERLEILFHEGSDKVTERWLDGDQIRTHASYRPLLAAEGFGSLRRWTSQQRRSLRHLKSAYDRRIPVTGVLSNEGMPLDVHRFDEFLVAQKRAHEHSVQVMLIDGPAGIGKTRFIEFLAWARANRFLTMQDPLILQVQSRGRVLTYLQDLSPSACNGCSRGSPKWSHLTNSTRRLWRC